MPSQFSHVSTFSRKNAAGQWSAGQIADEAGRKPEASKHVKNPQPPVQFHGHPIETLGERLDAFCAGQKATVKGKDGSVKERAIRSDQHVLMASVYSWPESVNRFDREAAEAYFRDCISFHEREFGAEVQSAVMHLDETHPHIHVYSFHANARHDHCGWVAKRSAEKDGRDPTEAYKQAMEGFQQRFYEQVGMHHGLDRLGPRRQRIAPENYRAWKEGLRITAEAAKISEPIKAKVEELRSEGRKLIKMTETLKIKIGAESDRLKTIRDEAQSLNSKLLTAQKAGGVVQAMRKAFYSAIGQETPEIQVLRLEIETKEKAEQKARSNLKNLHGQINDLSTKNNRLGAENQALKREVEDLKIDKEELLKEGNEIIDTLKKEIETLKNPQKPDPQGPKKPTSSSDLKF